MVKKFLCLIMIFIICLIPTAIIGGCSNKSDIKLIDSRMETIFFYNQDNNSLVRTKDGEIVSEHKDVGYLLREMPYSDSMYFAKWKNNEIAINRYYVQSDSFEEFCVMPDFYVIYYGCSSGRAYDLKMRSSKILVAPKHNATFYIESVMDDSKKVSYILYKYTISNAVEITRFEGNCQIYNTAEGSSIYFIKENTLYKLNCETLEILKLDLDLYVNDIEIIYDNIIISTASSKIIIYNINNENMREIEATRFRGYNNIKLYFQNHVDGKWQYPLTMVDAYDNTEYEVQSIDKIMRFEFVKKLSLVQTDNYYETEEMDYKKSLQNTKKGLFIKDINTGEKVATVAEGIFDYYMVLP